MSSNTAVAIVAANGSRVESSFWQKGHPVGKFIWSGLAGEEPWGIDVKNYQVVKRALRADEWEALKSKPGPVLLKDLVGRLEAVFRRYIYFRDPRVTVLLALWVVQTYLFESFDYCGYLWLTSASKGCGKSHLLRLLSELSANPTGVEINLTAANLFRFGELKQTLTLDEAESLSGADAQTQSALLEVLNSGYEKGGHVTRLERVGRNGKQEQRTYNTYCPKAIAGIGDIKETLEDRSFKILMRKQPRSVKSEKFKMRRIKPELASLRRPLRQWTSANGKRVEQIYNTLPDESKVLQGLDGRFEDIAEPLCVLAILADTETARAMQDGSLVAATSRTVSEEQLIKVDLWEAWHKRDSSVWKRLSEAIKALGASRNEDEDENEPLVGVVRFIGERLGETIGVFIPTKDIRAAKDSDGNPLWKGNPNALARALKKLDLKPRKSPDRTQRGYWISREWIEEVGESYGYTPKEASQASLPSQTQQNQPLTVSPMDRSRDTEGAVESTTWTPGTAGTSNEEGG